MKKLASAFLLTLGLTSCETTVTLPEPAHTPRIALLYTLSDQPLDTNSTVMVGRQPFVSYSQRVFNTKELTGRADATVEILDAAGTVVERFKPGPPRKRYSYYSNSPGLYTPTMGLAGKTGETYTLRASLPGFETVESTLTMPAKPVIDNATFVVRSGNLQPSQGGSNEVKGRLTITLADNAATADHYVAFARLLDKQGNAFPYSSVYTDYDDQSSDFEVGRFELSSEDNSYGNSLKPYDDSNVNGKQFSLNANVQFYVQGCYGNPTIPRMCQELGYIEVRVSNITADAYKFYQSMNSYYNSQDNPFAEPAPLASNIKSGYGVFGAAADATYRIKLF
ncbi:DUF4249 domain-containing protein [Hymenobacter cavernae]|uniref:DUF4249 domain-containing protein n=1 Tax=Hymenobacter cavernae TaxID=2044852 RepID=A0ABQ1UCE2_9BACT|nr:DUF4249 domain-containing protein [Hymenobacter cavernae]GGF14652.1 hypothetical protein GCM10011383_27310 [Hymenobacter cavernae]